MSAIVIPVDCTPLPVPSDLITTLSVPKADAAVTSQLPAGDAQVPSPLRYFQESQIAGAGTNHFVPQAPLSPTILLSRAVASVALIADISPAAFLPTKVLAHTVRATGVLSLVA